MNGGGGGASLVFALTRYFYSVKYFMVPYVSNVEVLKGGVGGLAANLRVGQVMWSPSLAQVSVLFSDNMA